MCPQLWFKRPSLRTCQKKKKIVIVRTQGENSGIVARRNGVGAGSGNGTVAKLLPHRAAQRTDHLREETGSDDQCTNVLAFRFEDAESLVARNPKKGLTHDLQFRTTTTPPKSS